MRLKRYRFKTESLRIDIQIFICYEEYGILLGCPQTSKSRKYNCLTRKENRLQLSNEVTDNLICYSQFNII